MTLNYVTVVLNLYDGGGSQVSKGTAQLTPSAQLTDTVPGDDMLVIQAPVPAAFQVTGFPRVLLLSTDSDGPLPAGWGWGITFNGVPGGPAGYSFLLPASPLAFTATQATPAVFTASGSSYADGTGVELTGGSLPAGFTAGTTYYVVAASDDEFSLAATPGGPAIASTSTGSGTVTTTVVYLSSLTKLSTAPALSGFMPLPTGTPQEGQVPAVITDGSPQTEWVNQSGGGGGGGNVDSVTAADTSIVVGGTSDNPTVRTGTLDVIATQHPPAAAWSNNGKKITSIANAASAQDAVALGQLGSAAFAAASAFDAAGAAATAQSTAEAFATAAVGTETSRAETAEALLAPLASPALTGDPTAPTATPGTATTQLATTAYADAAVAVEASRAGAAEALKLAKASNLSDLASASTARTNLGLGSAAVQPSSAFDAAGAASAAQSNAEAFASPAVGLAPSGDITGATDTAAIQALSNLGTRRIILQAGTFWLAGDGTASDGCVRLGNSTELAGQGIGVTTLKLAAGASSDVTGMVRTYFNVQNSDVTVRDLTIDGNGANVSGTPRIVGFYCGTIPDSTTTDTDISCVRVEIMNCTGYGFDPHERTTRLLLLDCLSHGNGFGGNPFDGITLDGNYDATVIGCVSYGNTRHGFNLTTASARCRIVACEASTNGGNGFNLVNGSKLNVLADLAANANTGDGIFISGVPNTGTVIDATQGADNSVTGCMVLSSGTNGIHIYGSPRNHLASCTIRDSSQAATNTSAQILLDDDAGTNFATNNTVTGCDLGVTGVAATPIYGIREHSSGDDFNTYFGNASAGATSAQVSLQGTHSQAITAAGNALALADGTNLHLGTSTGTQIGTTTSDKIGFYGATPIGQQAATNELGTVLANFGLRAAGGAFPITTSGLCQLTGSIRYPFTARTAGATLTAGSSAENETVDATSGPITINLTATATGGYKFTIIKTDSSANAVTIDAGSGNTINGTRTFVLSAQDQYVTVISTATSGVWYAAAAGLATTPLPESGGTMTGWLAPAVAALSQSAGLVAVNAALGNVFTLALTASTWTISNPTNPVNGQVIRFRVSQDATGSRTVSWGTAYDWGSTAGTPNSAPTLTTTASKTDYLAFEYDSDISKWVSLGAPFPQGF